MSKREEALSIDALVGSNTFGISRRGNDKGGRRIRSSSGENKVRLSLVGTIKGEN